jgi:hypothetical protein
MSRSVVVAGEGFGLIMGAERLLSAREERQRAAAMTNTARWTATVRFEAANSALAAAEAAMLKEAGRGGCKGACQALQVEADRARQRLETANSVLDATPAEKNRALLTTTLGLPPALVEIVPALLFSTAINGLAFTLLALAHGPVSSGVKVVENQRFENCAVDPSDLGPAMIHPERIKNAALASKQRVAG